MGWKPTCEGYLRHDDRQANRTSGKQTNRRAKGSEKQRLLHHAEEMPALRCSRLSGDGRWKRGFDAVNDGRIVISRSRASPASKARDLATSEYSVTVRATPTRMAG